MHEDSEEASNPSFCSKDYEILTFKATNIFSYLFTMLLYSVFVYYGFNYIIYDYIYEIIDIDRFLMMISIVMGFVFILIVIISYETGKFAFLYYITRIIISIIVSNLGVVLFLSQAIELTYMEVVNLFLYMLIVSFAVSILSWGMIRLLIQRKCTNLNK